MRKLLVIAFVAMLVLSACAASRHKLSPQGNVNLKSADVAYNQNPPDVEEALEYYQLVLKDNPDHAHALRRVADINLYNGERFTDLAVPSNKTAFENYDKAIKQMEKYEKPTEKELAAIRDMKKRRTSAWTRVYKAGEAQAEAGNTMEAVRIFEIVTAMDTTRVEPLIKLKNIYQKDLKDETKAESIMLTIYNKNPNDPLLLQEMSILYMNKKDYTAALPFIQKVKVAEPLNVNNLMNLTYCQYELGLYADAKVTSDLILTIEPNNILALRDAKSIAYKLNEKEVALGYLKKLLDLEDNESDYQEICFMLNEMKAYTDMITYAKKWYNYDDTNKDAVRLIILGATMTKNKILETEYNNILKNMN